MRQSTHRRRLRFRRQPRNVALLTALWLVLVGQVNLFSVLGGIALALIVTLVFPLPPIRYRGRLRLGPAIKLGVVLLKDLAVSSFRLAAWAFRPQAPTSGIVRVRLRTDSDLYQVNTAELTSVVPGTIVVDARRSTRVLYLHVFDMTSPGAAESARSSALAVERRVANAFASGKELARAYPGERAVEGER